MWKPVLHVWSVCLVLFELLYYIVSSYLFQISIKSIANKYLNIIRGPSLMIFSLFPFFKALKHWLTCWAGYFTSRHRITQVHWTLTRLTTTCSIIWRVAHKLTINTSVSRGTLWKKKYSTHDNLCVVIPAESMLRSYILWYSYFSIIFSVNSVIILKFHVNSININMFNGLNSLLLQLQQWFNTPSQILMVSFHIYPEQHTFIPFLKKIESLQ